MTTRCDEVVVQLVVRVYDDDGKPVGEQLHPPGKVFRASTPDFWAAVDTVLKNATKAPTRQPGPEHVRKAKRG